MKIQTAQPPSFKKKKFSSVSDVENSFKKIDFDGDGRLTKQEMLRGNEFTHDEVGENYVVESKVIHLICNRLRPYLNLEM